MAKKPKPEKTVKADPRAMLATAEQLHRAGRLVESMRAYQVLLGHAPDLPPALYNLGQIHRQRAEFQDAEYCFRRILHANPNDLEAMTALAATCIELGDTEEARELAVRAASLSGAAFIQMRCATIMSRTGDLSAAQQMTERVIAAEPENVEGYYTLSTLKKFKQGDAELKKMLMLGERAGALPDRQRIKLEFALGNAMFDIGEDAAAFAHYATANRLKRLAYKHFNIGMVEKYVDSIISFFTPEFVQRFAQAGAVASGRPVFIVGMPRSGSTLTEQILSCHPQMAAMGEVTFFDKSLPVYPNAEVPGLFPTDWPSITKKLVDSISSETLDAIGQTYLQLTEPFAKHDAKLSDKMLFNFFNVGLIRMALPNAKIIHCSRDPVSIGLSIWRLHFYADCFWAYDMQDIARYYLAYKKLMAHWNSVFPGQIFEANYENMVADQEAETRRLLEFCDLPFDAACLNFHENDRPVITASAQQVRQGIYNTSVARWKKYEQYLQPMINTLGEVNQSHAR